MTHEKDDDAVARITRALDATLIRFFWAKTIAVQEDETSTALHHLYRLAVAVHGDPVGPGTGWEKLIGNTDASGLVPPLVLMRHKDVHELVAQSETTDTYAEYETDLYGNLQWRFAAFMESEPRTERYRAREKLEGTSVYDSLRNARDALAPTPFQTSS